MDSRPGGAGGGYVRTHEPLALAGRILFVPAKLILAAQDEGEFAGMLAHAMAHVAKRHETGRMTLEKLAGGQAGEGIGRSVQTSRRRAFESEADGLAIRAMASAGYAPEALVGYIGRVQDDGKWRKDFLRLPAREVRVAQMETAIRAIKRREYAFSDDEFLWVQDKLRAAVQSGAPVLLRRAQR